MGVQNILGYFVGGYKILRGTKYPVTPVTGTPAQRAGVGSILHGLRYEGVAWQIARARAMTNAMRMRSFGGSPGTFLGKAPLE